MSVVETPLMPQALDAEEALLGSILIDPDALLAARSLKPDAFYRDAHATLFATIRQLEDDGIAVDSVTVLTRLERTGQLARAGGSSYVLGLVNAVPTSMNAHYYAHLVQKAAEGRKVIEVGGAIASIGYHSSDPAKAALRAVETLAAAHEEADGLDLTPEEALARLEALAPPLYAADDLLAQEFNPPKWVVPDLLPEGLTLLAAKPKLGKSWMALGLALAVASGGLALGRVPVTQGEVLYLALEDSPKRLHERVKRLLRGQPAPHALQLGTDWPRLDQGGVRLLEVWRRAHPGARLLILDTFAKIRGRAKSGTLYGDDYASLEEVQRLAHAYEMAVLVIHHTGKESREDPLDEVNATQGLNGVADNILVLRRERGKPSATLIGDGRELNGIEQTLRFDVDEGGWKRTEPELDQPKTRERAEILDLLKASEQPMTSKQVAEALEKNVSTIRNIIAKMVHTGEVKMSGYGKYISIDSVDSVDSVDTSIKQTKKRNEDTFIGNKEGSS